MTSTVKSWMTRDPVTTAPDTSALDAQASMLRFGIRHLPVVDEHRQLVGILSVDDLRAALSVGTEVRAPLPADERAAAAEWRVGDLMSFGPSTVGPDALLTAAADLMASRRFGCLPVVDRERRLVGILSETDLLRALASGRGAQRIAPSVQEALLADLSQEREAILAQLGKANREEQRLTSEFSDAPSDVADRGERYNELRLTESLAGFAARRLAALDRALERAAEARLDVCESCGGRIPLARLRALPGTTRCIDCARAGERAGA